MLACLVLGASACGEGTLGVEEEEEADRAEAIVSELSSNQRRNRVELIKRAAAERGLSNSVLLAGIANAETGLAHCWSELKWACQGPASSSCGGGPVVAGAGDGPCWKKQGGLGYFQFDGGTFDQTLRRDGRGILTVEGNTHKAVEFVVNMVVRSRYISGVSNESQALEWLNGVRVDGNNWNPWVQTVTHYYNGCKPNFSCYNQRFRHYSNHGRVVYREFGHTFWYDTPAKPAEPPRQPKGLSPQNVELEKGDFIRMSWAAVSGANYDVKAEYLPQGDDTWRHYHTWTDRPTNSFNMWPQFDDAKYRWSIRACVGSTCSEFSAPSFFNYGDVDSNPAPQPQPQPEPPKSNVPGSMSPAGGQISTPSVDLTWSGVEGSTHYDVHFMYRRNSGDNWREYFTWKGRKGERFQVWPQSDNSHYQWQVRACDGSSCGEWSEFESFFFTGK